MRKKYKVRELPGHKKTPHRNVVFPQFNPLNSEKINQNSKPENIR